MEIAPRSKRHMTTPAGVSGVMTEGCIWKSIVLFSIPLILGNLLQQLYNTADSVIVGMYAGGNAFAAVSSSTFLISFMIAFSMGVSAGAGVVVSQFLGAGSKAGVDAAVHTALAFSLILGSILTMAGVLLGRDIMNLMEVPSVVMEDSVSYFRLYSAGLLFSIIYNMAAGILNAAGDSRHPLLFLAVASVVNILLDLLLVACLKMGVAGAAVATDFSQMVSCVLILGFLMRSGGDCRFRLRKLRIEKEMLIRIVRIGLPTGIQNMLISLSNVFVQTGVNRFGVAAVAGYGAYMRIDGFNILPVMSLSLAMTTFAGQNCGAGKISRVKKGLRITLVLALLYTIPAAVLILVFAAPLIRIFTQESAAIACGVLVTWNIGPVYFMQGIIHVLAGAVRGTGKAVPPMVILLFTFCACRIAWLHWGASALGTLEGVLLVYPASITLGMILMILYVRKADWLRKSGKMC